ncbi:MAG: tetratricopeptide repeat protein [Planctomycetaceae bacterium]
MSSRCARRMTPRAPIAILVVALGLGCARPPAEVPERAVEEGTPGPVVARPSFAPVADSDTEREAAAIRDGCFDEAEELVRLLPRSAPAWRVLAAVHRRYGDADGATRVWEHCLTIDPDDADAQRRLGEAAFDGGDLEEAERRFRLALAADPAAVEVTGQLADTLLRRGDFDGAVELVEVFVKAHPRVAEAWCALGKARVARGETAEAREAFEQALSIDGESREAHHGLGRLFQAGGDAEAARPHLREVVRLDDEKARRHRDGDAAESDRAAPGVWAADVHNEAALLHAARGDLARAERGWQRAVELDPDFGSARELLARLYARSGRASEALAVRRAWCAARPEDAAAWFGLAEAAAAAGDTGGAEEALARLATVAPDHAGGLALSARLVSKRDPAAALVQARRAVEIDPSAAHEYVLADMLLRNGRRDEAIRALRRAVALAPDDPRYRATLGQLEGAR